MPDEFLSIVARGASMIGRFVIEILPETICGNTGRCFVRIITFGKIQLDPESGWGSVIAPLIGLAVWIGVATAIWYLCFGVTVS